MENTIEMKDLLHLNLFNKISQVRTRFCFYYNEALVFCVPKKLVSKAIGEGGRNVKQISSIIGKKIKVIPMPEGLKDLKSFISSIVSPVEFKEVNVSGNEIILTAGSQSKAALIGRDKRRLFEMQKIIKSYFGKDFRII